MARAHRGQVAVFARHLRTGATVAWQADRTITTASTIKLGVLVEAMYQVHAGERNLSEPIVVRGDDKVKGSGVLRFLHDGLQVTFEDVLVLMMIASDNTATNLAIDRVGGVGRVNARMRALGLRGTHLYKRVYKPAIEPMPADQKQFGLGKSTARELAQLMEHVHACKLGALCDRMIAMMREQQTRYLVARYIETVDTTEQSSTIAAKIGELDRARMEVALVDTDTGPIVMAIATWDNVDERYSPDNEAAILIARIAEAIVRGLK